MPDDFVIARNPEEGTTLPYLLRIPLGQEGIVLKSREMWPRTAKVYCHRAEGWPDDAEVIERVPTRVCTRRGAAIDLVLDRGRENRSQFVLTNARGRQMIFWQSARTAKQARPNVSVPTARAGSSPTGEIRWQARDLEIIVDVHERYAWTFGKQQATTTSAPLSAGDYAVKVGGEVVAAVERKSLADLSASLINGTLRYALTELSQLGRAAVVVEDRYSGIFKNDYVRPAQLANAIAECHARYPNVPIVFAETRQLAQEWTYRFLAAAAHEAGLESRAVERLEDLAPAAPLPPREASTAEVRAWATAEGLPVSDRGRLRPQIWDAYRAAHSAVQSTWLSRSR